MRLLFFILLFPLALAGQVSYNFTPTPLSGTYQRWGVGNDRWNEQSGGQIVSDYHGPTIYYRRFTVCELVASNGAFFWTRFDSKINEAIENHQKFAFGFMSMYAWPESDAFFNLTPTLSGIDGRTGNNVSARSAVPQEWHTAMQAGSPRNWISESGDWVPQYNSEAYLSRAENFLEGVNNHLDTGSYTPTWSDTAIPYRNVISYIDIRMYGTWGEWHSYGTAPGNNVQNYPPGTFPTVATFKRIIDAHVNGFPNYQLVCINNIYDGGRLQNIGIPAEVGVYALQRRNNKGFIGGRNDHAGEVTGYDDFQLFQNPYSFNGFRMDTAQQYRHRLAPRRGEPPGGPVTFNGVVQGALPGHARKWKYASIGNGNYGSGNTPTGAGADSVRLAYHLMGYHLRINSGSAVVGANFQINAKWQNYGLTPTYDDWTVEFSLRNGAGTTVWTGNSSFNPYLFASEQGEITRTDNFTSPAVAAGTYSLYLRVKDPTGYMEPLPLQITGRTNGYYFLTNVVLTGGTSNRPPVPNAGANQTIIQPDDDASLTGSASDPDGTIASYAWAQISGPTTATINSPTSASTTIDDLTTIGSYVFRFTVTDNSGATGFDEVTITVAAAPNLPPVSVPGNPQTIQLPDTDAALTGSGTDSDGTIVSYLWFLFSGPDVVNFSDATSANTTVSGLKQGTYFISLTVTDDDGLSDTRSMQITVLPAAQGHGRYKWQRVFRNN